ncbi:DUF4145 domain-containing protein [Shewanella sp. 10N.261.52.F9]|uniref:DUF4145 domain-containing protein n=1 Tax=Shewanella sp. 10N.261.52.F9 TaxID=3229684 RepID=UPI0035503175
MNAQITDLQLAKSLSLEIFNEYSIALEFIYSNPDYTLLKFRETISSTVHALEDFHLVPENSNCSLMNRIIRLEAEHFIDENLASHLHSVRKLGNRGAHTNERGEGGSESFAKRKLELSQLAVEARVLTINVMKQALATINQVAVIDDVKLVDVGVQDQRELVFNALRSQCTKMKLLAGIATETELDEQCASISLLIPNDKAAHLQGIANIALSFYESSYSCSAPVDDFMHLYPHDGRSIKELEKSLCDLEPLYRYGALAITDGFPEDISQKGILCLEAAAKRGYGPAEALYGSLLFEQEEYEQAFKYLSQAVARDDTTALCTMFYYYTTGKACLVDRDKAHFYIMRAIEQDCPVAMAHLGIAYYEGKGGEQDLGLAKFYLTKASDFGNLLAKRYLLVLFTDITEQFQNQFKASTHKLVTELNKLTSKAEPQRKLAKIKRNDLCPCSSGAKYKNCCLNKSKVLPHSALNYYF